MAERQPAAPTHRVYTVIRREGQDDYWLNIGLAFPHKDGKGFNIMLQAFRSTARSSAARSPRRMQTEPAPPARGRQETPRSGQGGRRR